MAIKRKEKIAYEVWFPKEEDYIFKGTLIFRIGLFILGTSLWMKPK
jgi:hypothetical protein